MPITLTAQVVGLGVDTDPFRNLSFSSCFIVSTTVPGVLKNTRSSTGVLKEFPTNSDTMKNIEITSTIPVFSLFNIRSTEI